MKHTTINTAVCLLMSLGLAACSGGSSSHTETIKREVVSTPSVISGEVVEIRTGGSSEAAPAPTTPTTSGLTATETLPADTKAPTPPDMTDNSKPETETDKPKMDTVEPPKPAANSDIERVSNEGNIYFKKQPSMSYHYALLPSKVAGSAFSITDKQLLGKKPDAAFNRLEIKPAEKGEPVGELIELFPAGETGNEWINKEDNVTKWLSRGQHTLSGQVQLVEDGKMSLFVVSQGKNPTSESEIPNKGTAIYNGQGHHGFYIVEEDTFSVQPSLVSFTADFGEKTLRGKVDAAEEGTFESKEIAAHIQGNAFSGKINDIALHGGFFGENGKEITGSYFRHTGSTLDENTLIGTFNAAKSE